MIGTLIDHQASLQRQIGLLQRELLTCLLGVIVLGAAVAVMLGRLRFGRVDVELGG